MRSLLPKKIALAMQIAAMVLVQFYALVPSLSLALLQGPGHDRSGLCRGNHVQCGCAPERISSRTCCCYRQAPSCCDLNSPVDVPEVGRQKGDTSVPHVLCTAPCGSNANFASVSVQQLKFVPSERHAATVLGTLLLLAFPLEEKASGRVAEPPDPPPNLVFPS